MPYSTGQTVRRSFTVADLSGLVAPDSLPTGLVRKNGSTLGGTTVTVTNNSTGDYTASFTMPSAVAGDTFELVVTALVGGLTQKYTEAIDHADASSVVVGSLSVAARQQVYYQLSDPVEIEIASVVSTDPFASEEFASTVRLNSSISLNASLSTGDLSRYAWNGTGAQKAELFLDTDNSQVLIVWTWPNADAVSYKLAVDANYTSLAEVAANVDLSRVSNLNWQENSNSIPGTLNVSWDDVTFRTIAERVAAVPGETWDDDWVAAREVTGGTVDTVTNPVGTTTDGPGADEVTLTFTKEGSVPIADADVWITSDSGGDNVVAGTLQTNSDGEVTFMLDDGATYYSWLQKDGVNSIRGQSFVADAD